MAEPADDATERGRTAFRRGHELAAKERWGEALRAFRVAAEARDSAVVQFNIGYCERALGRYVAADRSIRRALAFGSGLTPPQVEDARGYLEEFQQLTATVHVTVVPRTAALSVDGRALVPIDKRSSVWAAGLAEAGEGTRVGVSKFRLLLDPGVHVFRAARPGHADAVVKRTLRPGGKLTLDLDLARLPATMRVQSDPAGAVVVVDGREVGLAPVEVERKAGRHVIEVIQDGFETYSATVDVAPGQRTELTADLEPYSAPLYARWWFWGAAAGVVAAGAVATWALTRPDPVPPPYDGGTADWVVQGATFRF